MWASVPVWVGALAGPSMRCCSGQEGMVLVRAWQPERRSAALSLGWGAREAKRASHSRGKGWSFGGQGSLISPASMLSLWPSGTPGAP